VITTGGERGRRKARTLDQHALLLIEYTADHFCGPDDGKLWFRIQRLSVAVLQSSGTLFNSPRHLYKVATCTTTLLTNPALLSAAIEIGNLWSTCISVQTVDAFLWARSRVETAHIMTFQSSALLFHVCSAQVPCCVIICSGKNTTRLSA
jgi:hypothetical protein